MTPLPSIQHNIVSPFIQLDDAALQVYKDGDFGSYLDLESSLAEQSDEVDGLHANSRKNSLVVRTQLSVRVHAIIGMCARVCVCASIIICVIIIVICARLRETRHDRRVGEPPRAIVSRVFNCSGRECVSYFVCRQTICLRILNSTHTHADVPVRAIFAMIICSMFSLRCADSRMHQWRSRKWTVRNLYQRCHDFLINKYKYCSCILEAGICSGPDSPLRILLFASQNFLPHRPTPIHVLKKIDNYTKVLHCLTPRTPFQIPPSKYLIYSILFESVEQLV